MNSSRPKREITKPKSFLETIIIHPPRNKKQVESKKAKIKKVIGKRLKKHSDEGQAAQEVSRVQVKRSRSRSKSKVRHVRNHSLGSSVSKSDFEKLMRDVSDIKKNLQPRAYSKHKPKSQNIVDGGDVITALSHVTNNDFKYQIVEWFAHTRNRSIADQIAVQIGLNQKLAKRRESASLAKNKLTDKDLPKDQQIPVSNSSKSKIEKTEEIHPKTPTKSSVAKQLKHKD